MARINFSEFQSSNLANFGHPVNIAKIKLILEISGHLL